MTTQNLGELFAALAMARHEFGTLTKGKTASIRSDKGASYTYSYADLSDVIEATAAALAKHGLVVIQEPEVISDGGRQLVVINGCIAHKSGAIYQLRPLPLPVAGGTAQAIGSAISYGRRYQLSAALNLAASDDDGNEAGIGASAPRSAQNAPKTTQKAQQPASAPKRTVDATTGEILEPVKPVDEDFYKPVNPLLGGTGNGKHVDNPFEQTAPPTDDENDILSTWSTPEDAKVWAVNVGACENDHEACNSFKKIVDANGGRLTKANAAAVYLQFLRRQMEKLEAQAELGPELAF